MNYGLHFIAVSMIATGLFPCLAYGQEPPKKVPDSIDGLELTARPSDSASKKLPPNEFNGQ